MKTTNGHAHDTLNSKHSVLQAKIVENYRAQGFDVVLDPQQTDIPFDLGEYRPDMLVRTSPSEGYIIEVKPSIAHTTLERYQKIADMVTQHRGWSFLLVTDKYVTCNAHNALQSQIAEAYKMQGFDVVLDPQQTDLPFGLGGYLPDILVRTSSNEGYIIEVKPSMMYTPVERYMDIADTVAEHPGWVFLLATGEDVALNVHERNDEGFLTWDDMLKRRTQAEQLLSQGQTEAAFLFLWVTLEAAMRRAAKELLIPIQHLPTDSLIQHMYSVGDLSMGEFDAAEALLKVRNCLVHGYYSPVALEEATKQLHELVNELLTAWVEDDDACLTV